MAAYAVLFVLVGLALLFVPAFVLGVRLPEGVLPFAHLLGAAFAGFAASNWIARRAPMGGIYGRAVVLGNQGFALVGALALLGSRPGEPTLGFWLLHGPPRRASQPHDRETD